MRENLFLDTSALVKLYILEAGSAPMERIVRLSLSVSVSMLAEFEFLSALQRRRIGETLSEEQALQAKAAFYLDWTSSYRRQLLSDEVLSVARNLLGKHRLRTLDSMQLASAMVLAKPTVTFVTADRALAETARLEGLATYDPTVA